MDCSDVLFEKTGALATITLNRPDKVNALSKQMRSALDRRLRQAAEDASVQVVLICGAGASFCGGLDLTDLPDSPLTWRERVLAAQANHMAIVRMPKIVIAAVQGSVVGGGASLALSADILIMADNAHLSFPFVRLGIVPDGGSSYFLQAKLGVPLALDLLLTGGKLEASEAARLGLTRRLVPADELLPAARKLANDLIKLPPEAGMLTKSLCRQYWGSQLDSVLSHEADTFGLATTTPGHLQAIAQLSSRSQ
ncbi:enoyl-CoA hydratase/isomerase family protein [Alcaligenaceae bacterium]|nr:enoyl-CoA hydratase/isomerase family protein [Alcaligenaceae bacterium]